jgi:hypothetical protein
MAEWTRRGLERLRFLAFVQMTRSGATKDEAYTYIDLIHPVKTEPFEEEPKEAS